ncbi:tetratricopeptide repeat protein [Marinobacter sp. V034]|uniref:tetratricopeptide repeat protein n=1 Tax=Marinobacter TaxID=2742 RepID=UPI004043E9B7
MSINDLPKRGSSHSTEEAAEAVFFSAIGACGLFINQGSDRRDYGSDIQIEALRGDSVTNVRIHVQLKGTNQPANQDGSVSVSVQRTNLNYLLAHPASIYVCYHLPTDRLLACYAEEIHRQYSHREDEWEQQESITVNLQSPFNEAFQHRLSKRAIAANNSSRDRRLAWTVTPPKQIGSLLRKAPAIHVPPNPEIAQEILVELYNDGQDAAISAAFEQFEAVLDPSSPAIDFAYMAEINLGINGHPIDESRVRAGIEALERSMKAGKVYPGSMLYCIGNAWLALQEYEKAKTTYRSALCELEQTDLIKIAAQCYKNLGSVMERLGDNEKARKCYVQALEIDPGLSEAHFALALWYRGEGNNLERALDHLDKILPRGNSELKMTAVQGWRINLLFRLGAVSDAFRDIRALLGEADSCNWIWPWCAREVFEFGRKSVEATRHALQFWQAYLEKYPTHHVAQSEELMCHWKLKSAGEPTGIDFGAFKNKVREVLSYDDSNEAFLWDRIGHWAQYDGDWVQAEKAYRKAFLMDPVLYGYCFGTALNHLGRYTEALPILIDQAERHLPDAMSWFQVAIAYEHTSDAERSIAAYLHAIEQDENYDLAWFNLGGVCWNSDQRVRALSIWREAITRFPDHWLADKLRQDFSEFF